MSMRLRRRDRSRGDLGTANLPVLAASAVAAVIGHHGEDAEVCLNADRLIQFLATTARTLAERTHAEFTVAPDWTVEQRQGHSLRAIVALADEVRRILADPAFGPDVDATVTALVRETYFARLREVALGAQARPGSA